MTSASATKQVFEQTEDEPPLCVTKVSSEEEDEPPSSICKPSTSRFSRNKLFDHIPDKDWNDWRWQFRHRLTTIGELSKFIPLSDTERSQIELVVTKYPFSVTPHYLSLIDLEDPEDPIRKQAIPSFLEITMSDKGTEDPLEEKRDSVVPGLVHRYPNRVLMVLTDICPMLCRHCTRKREWQHGGWVRKPEEIKPMIDYIRSNKQVRDVVISGGDPLTLSTSRLEEVISQLRQIEHLEIIRIGSRYPVVLPQRIDAELCDMLSKYGPIWLNTHFNHYNEISPASVQAIDRLTRAGVPVNNQSVLMRGINDSVEAQLKLCHGLLKSKVRPYYLFQCDEVQGTGHLHTPVETGLKIIQGMRGFTSGLAIPTYVIDLAHGGGKVPLQPNYVVAQTKGELILRNYQGRVFRFRNPPEDLSEGDAVRTENQHGVEAVDEDRALVRS